MGKDLRGKELGSGLVQRKDGLYQARYKDRFGNTKVIYSRKLSDLKKDFAQALSENINFTSVRDDIKLDDWFNRWLKVYKEKSVRPNTIREYTHIYNKNISPFLGNCNINFLVKSNIQYLIDITNENGYGFERQNKIKVILSDMFSRAMEDDLMVKNPAKGVKLRCKKEFNAHSLSITEQEKFFEACKDTFYDNLFNVALNTGLRPGELFALTESDIHLNERYIDVNKTLVYQKYLTDSKKTFHIEPPKTEQSYRHVPINSICYEYLIRQIELKKVVSCKKSAKQSEYLFITKFNTPLNSQIYSDAIKAVIENNNLADEITIFSGHTFRHTFATRCFEAGVPAKVVQSYLGHASLKMTMDLYTHVTKEKSFADIEKIVPKGSRKIINFPCDISLSV